MDAGDPASPHRVYEQIASSLRDQVAAGRYQPGDQLPNESQLASHFGVARATIRHAIGLLKNEGVLEAEHGRGTFVKRPTIRLPFSRYRPAARVPDAGPFEATCRQLGIPGYGEVVLVERRPATDVVAAGLGLPAGADIIYRRRHMHAGEPDAVIQIQEGHLPADVVDGTPLAGSDKLTGGTYAALDAIGHGPTRITEELSARMPTYDESSVLRLTTGVPVIDVRRSTYDSNDRVVEWLIVTASADRNIFVYNDLPL